MKLRLKLLLFLGVLVMASCQKIEIPEPDDTPVGEPEPRFYIKGNFNGDYREMFVDGDVHHAVSYLAPFQSPSGAYSNIWQFDLYDSTDSFFPQIVIGIHNHDDNPNNTYEDLVTTTSVNALYFVEGGPGPDPIVENRIFFHYCPNDTSDLFSIPTINEPLIVVESKDTVFEDKSYRIVGLEGNMTLFNFYNGTLYYINDFEARIVLSL